MKKATEIKEQSLFEELGLLNTMGGTSGELGLNGRVKTRKIFPKIWSRHKKEDLEELSDRKEYYNKEGFIIKEEFYQKEIRERTSVYKYENNLLFSEKSTDKNNNMNSHCEFTYLLLFTKTSSGSTIT